MRYHIQGNGKSIILIHGWAMHSGVWDEFVKDFSERYRTITVDLRGHGKSASMEGPYNFATFAQDIVNLIIELELRNITLIGWSMGVSTILKMSACSLPCVDSLVLMSGNPCLVKRTDYNHGITEIMLRQLLRQTRRDYGRGLQNFYDLLFTAEELAALQTSRKYSKVIDKNHVPLQQAVLESLKCFQDEDLRGSLQNIDVPTLIIHGGNDKICVPDASYYMHKRIKDSKLLFLKDTGHLPFITKKEEVHHVVDEFLSINYHKQS